LLETAKEVSSCLFPGLPFGGTEAAIYDECPAVYIAHPILGLDIVLAGSGANGSYELSIFPHHSTITFHRMQLSASDSAPPGYDQVDLGEYVCLLLRMIPEIEVSPSPLHSPSPEAQQAFLALFEKNPDMPKPG
jgi:hypothetical protein